MGEMRKDAMGECPLCLDPYDLDDSNFYPCPCDYQICRFCWHRIKNDENGLCPACRQPYSDFPAQYKPLTKEQLSIMRIEKRNKASERKAKLAESRKHLAAVRVVQKCLVFVVGLSPRIADSETLKRPDFFGKFGKIHKCVVNNNTNYAGSTGHSASAYITFYKSEDALRAVQQTNNTQVDGRTLKASLGTTKYCSQFLKAQTCNKTDCMYLHELGDERASFTKEDMQQGKHQEYEQELHDEFYRREVLANAEPPADRYKTVYTLRSEANGHPVPPKVEADTPASASNSTGVNGSVGSNRTTPSPSNAWGDNACNHTNNHSPLEESAKVVTNTETEPKPVAQQGFSIFSNLEDSLAGPAMRSTSVEEDDPFSGPKSQDASWESTVFLGETYGDPARRFLSNRSSESSEFQQSGALGSGIPQLLNILGNRQPDDDLEFDPIKECQKGLEELLQKEHSTHSFNRNLNLSESYPSASSMYGMSSQSQLSQSFNGFHPHLQPPESLVSPPSSVPAIDRSEWQAGLRALLPNVNIQFNDTSPPNPTDYVPTTWQQSTWNSSPLQYNLSTEDPAIISTRKSESSLGLWDNSYQTTTTTAGAAAATASTATKPSQDSEAFLSSSSTNNTNNNNNTINSNRSKKNNNSSSSKSGQQQQQKSSQLFSWTNGVHSKGGNAAAPVATAAPPPPPGFKAHQPIAPDSN